MKIKPEQLKYNLEKEVKPIYFIFGKEILLVEQTLESIKKSLFKKGFEEKICFHIEDKFNWNNIFNENYNNSLFANKKIIEIRMHNTNINSKNSKAISEIADNLQEDTVIIICANKLDMKQQKSNWFKKIDNKGAIIQHWEIENHRLPSWILSNMQNLGLKADMEVVNAIAYYTEGNLLASMQEITKLKLSYPDGQVDKEQYLEDMYEQYDYSVFGLIDTALIGDAGKVNKIFNSLIKKATPIILIVGSLYYELQSLVKMAMELNNNKTIDTVLMNNNVWKKRQPFIKKALKNHSYKNIQKLILSLGRIDRSIKGVDNLNVYDETRSILIKLCAINK